MSQLYISCTSHEYILLLMKQTRREKTCFYFILCGACFSSQTFPNLLLTFDKLCCGSKSFTFMACLMSLSLCACVCVYDKNCKYQRNTENQTQNHSLKWFDCTLKVIFYVLARLDQWVSDGINNKMSHFFAACVYHETVIGHASLAMQWRKKTIPFNVY